MGFVYKKEDVDDFNDKLADELSDEWELVKENVDCVPWRDEAETAILKCVLKRKVD